MVCFFFSLFIFYFVAGLVFDGFFGDYFGRFSYGPGLAPVDRMAVNNIIW